MEGKRRSGSPKQARLACLSCRKKHLRCDETNPCKNCTDRGIECTYVESKRGGSRVKKPKLENYTEVTNYTPEFGVVNSVNKKKVGEYYNTFHHLHPLMAEQEVMCTILHMETDCKDLLTAMDAAVDVVGRPTSASAMEKKDPSKLLWEVCEHSPDDLFKLQALVLSFIVTKTLFSKDCEKFRTKAIDIALDIKDIGEFLHKKRTSTYKSSLVIPLKKCLCELYTMDVFLSAASGTEEPRMRQFDAKYFFGEHQGPGTPLYQCELRRRIVEVINTVVTSRPLTTELYRATRTELALIESEVIGQGLVGHCGTVNDTVFYAFMSLGFAKMLLNQPFAKTDHNMCRTDEKFRDDGNNQEMPLHAEAELACVGGASEIVDLISRLGVRETLLRTPMYCCALIQALIFYVRHFYWLSFHATTYQAAPHILTNITLGTNFLSIAKTHWPIAGVLLERFSALVNKRAPALNNPAIVANAPSCPANEPRKSVHPQPAPVPQYPNTPLTDTSSPLTNLPQQNPPPQEMFNDFNFGELEEELLNFMDSDSFPQ
ncbi:hypothetical protein TRICI_003196 [Trichomonascus ciferrii]|uniref:Zn(2)-C6 fungal-type domain-containing protein n=1 Tax=Trichomonascus ciferrii TaxID=44093 RepID=A0A642V4S3_9ASCO|nr:hypothetical protein TRICI_003196 [Trichomonascus ciferrii]